MKNPNLYSLLQSVFMVSRPTRTLLAAAVFSIGCCAGPTLAIWDIKNTAKQKDINEEDVFSSYSVDNKVGFVGMTVLPFIVLTILSLQIVNMGKEYEQARYIVKRKLRELSAQQKNLKFVQDTQILNNIADLIAAYMTDEEVMQIARSAADCVVLVRKNEGDTLEQNRVMLNAIDRITYVLNQVLARNPDLIKVIEDIALGKTGYTPVENINQKSH